jgi:hypothetical protein
MKFYQLVLASVFTLGLTSNAEAFLCGKKCQEKKAKGQEMARSENADCNKLSGKAKRVCRRTARKDIRAEAKELGLKGKDKRTYKRDQKANKAAFGGIGAKKANQQGRQSWDTYEQNMQELQTYRSQGKISEQQYAELSKEAEMNRQNKNFKIGRSKNLKTALAIGAGAAMVATGGLAAGMLPGAAMLGGKTAVMAGGGAAAGGMAIGAGAAGGRRGRQFAAKDQAFQNKIQTNVESNQISRMERNEIRRLKIEERNRLRKERMIEKELRKREMYQDRMPANYQQVDQYHYQQHQQYEHWD